MRRARQRRIELEEEDHSIALKREAEKVQHRVHMADLEHDTVIRHGDARSQQTLRHRGLEHNQDVQLAAEKHHNDANIAISEANTRSQIGWQAHRDDQEMRAEARLADLDHARQVQFQSVAEKRENFDLEADMRQRRYEQKYWQKDWDQAQNIEYRRKADEQDYWSTVQRSQAKLEYKQADRADMVEAQRQIQWYDRENLALQDEISSGKDMRKHQMRMLELETERGNIIGRVNLEEWGGVEEWAWGG